MTDRENGARAAARRLRARHWPLIGLLLAAICLPGDAGATIMQVTEAALMADPGTITFSEQPEITFNPVITPAEYGGGAGAPTVSFNRFFEGQSISANAAFDCPAAPANSCIVGAPTGPLTLDTSYPLGTIIAPDLATPTTPVIRPVPFAEGTIAMLFDVDLGGVGFTAGSLQLLNALTVTAFARDGSLLGSIYSSIIGFEFLGLATMDGTAQIAGLLVYQRLTDPGGFALDNVVFAQGTPLDDTPTVPEPGTLVLLLGGLAGLRVLSRRRAF